MKEAKCRGMGPELHGQPDIFFPQTVKQLIAAQTICLGCPVKKECDEFAQRTKTRFGVWGGRKRTSS